MRAIVNTAVLLSTLTFAATASGVAHSEHHDPHRPHRLRAVSARVEVYVPEEH